MSGGCPASYSPYCPSPNSGRIWGAETEFLSHFLSPSWWLSETLEDPAAILWPLSLLCSQLGSAAGCGGSSDRCLSNLPPPVPLAPLACQFPKAELGGGELKKECSGSVGSRPDGPVIQPAAPKPSQWICGGGRKGILNRYRINMLVDKALGSKTCVLAFLNQSPTYKVF